MHVNGPDPAAESGLERSQQRLTFGWAGVAQLHCVGSGRRRAAVGTARGESCANITSNSQMIIRRGFMAAVPAVPGHGSIGFLFSTARRAAGLCCTVPTTRGQLPRNLRLLLIITVTRVRPVFTTPESCARRQQLQLYLGPRPINRGDDKKRKKRLFFSLRAHVSGNFRLANPELPSHHG